MKIDIFALPLILFFATPALSLDGGAILKQVDKNLQPESFESYRKLINIEPSGAKREFLLYTLKKGNDKIVSLFISPASEKGRATLRLGDNMWLYIPNVGKPVRITSLQSGWAVFLIMPTSCASTTTWNTTCKTWRMARASMFSI